jgi:quercetin dioxygenase-like cupin family protein
MTEPLNIDDVQTVSLTSSASADAAWVGGFFAYGGRDGVASSVVISFAVPPGKRLGRHTDTAEETQFFLGGTGELVLDDGVRPVRAGDVVVLPAGTAHDLRNTGTDDLRVIGFFSAPRVEQHWSEEVWEPGGLTVTGSPDR